MPSQPDRDPLIPLLLILSGITGLIDAVSVLALGKVFTANMTGNVVFLGFAIAGAPGFQWRLFATALLAFAAGALIGGRLSSRGLAGRRRWLRLVAFGEGALLLLAAGAVTHGSLARNEAVTMAAIALTAVAMGLRNATARALKVADLTTTVLTLTITGVAADSRLAGGESPNLPRRLAAILSILAGSAAGAAMLLRWGPAVPLTVAAVIVLVATFALARDAEPTESRPAR
jgi:uncharacterized membrane protein YoaK (UPF0700 family)